MNQNPASFAGHPIARRRAGRSAPWRALQAAFGTSPRILQQAAEPSATENAISSVAAVYACVTRYGADRLKPDVAVVGGGLAGLTASYFLRQAGCPVTVYEASARLGGRIQTDAGGLESGVISELGGEFIDRSEERV